MEQAGFNTNIRPLSGLLAPKSIPKLQDEELGKAVDTFGQILKDQLAQVSNLDEQAEQLKVDFALGKPVELHSVILAEEKADLAMEFTMQVRNKAVAAYQTIWQMNI